MEKKHPIRLAGLWPFASLFDVLYCSVPCLFLLLCARVLVFTHLVPYGAGRAIAMGGTIGVVIAALRMVPFAIRLEGDHAAALSRRLSSSGFGPVSDENGKTIYRRLAPIWPSWDRRWDSDRIIIEQRDEHTRVTFPLQRISLIKRIT